MSASPIKPMCFVAMPFGKRWPPGKEQLAIDFDDIYGEIEAAVEAEGLECIRADFEQSGGFIHKPMFERLLVAEYVIADLTLGNPNVAYEVGVRHGSARGATILVCGDNAGIPKLPFDFAPLRVLHYPIEDDGSMTDDGRQQLASGLRRLIDAARRGELPNDNPITQITAAGSGVRIQHEKTDAFLNRMRYASAIGQRVAEALREPDQAAAVQQLKTIQDEVCSGGDTVEQLYTALISLYLGYREMKAYKEMVALYEHHLPADLQQTTVVREQLALALNRLAEGDEDEPDVATRRRREALSVLEEIDEADYSSETYGILGRIYKGSHTAARDRGDELDAKAMLNKAIESYEAGLRADPRDYFPGVNAVTLRLLRSAPEDQEGLDRLLPVVRFAVERAPEPSDNAERYWQAATRLELATAARDWEASEGLVLDLIGIESYPWMRETTANNLRLQQKTFADDATAVERLAPMIERLERG